MAVPSSLPTQYVCSTLNFWTCLGPTVFFLLAKIGKAAITTRGADMCSRGPRNVPRVAFLLRRYQAGTSSVTFKIDTELEFSYMLWFAYASGKCSVLASQVGTQGSLAKVDALKCRMALIKSNGNLFLDNCRMWEC